MPTLKSIVNSHNHKIAISHATNHYESRKKVCTLCIRKSKEKQTSAALQRIQKLSGQSVDLGDIGVSQGIFTTCRVSLLGQEKAVESALSIN